jgi:hypothetical protein
MLGFAVFEKNGVKYLSFEVAKLKQEDKFGRTHTCYFQTKVSSTIPPQDEEPAKQKKSGKKKSKKQTAGAEDDLPFQQNPKESRKAFFVSQSF